MKAVEELKNNVTDDVKLSLEEKSRDICAKWEVRTCTYVWGLCLGLMILIFILILIYTHVEFHRK